MKWKIVTLLILAVFSVSMTSGVFAVDKQTKDLKIKDKKNTDVKVKFRFVKVNKNFRIALVSNPSTGYNWVCKYDPKKIKLVKETFIPEDTKRYFKYSLNTHKKPMAGSSGISVFIFKALKPGHTDITMKYIRPWQKNYPEKVIIYHIFSVPIR